MCSTAVGNAASSLTAFEPYESYAIIVESYVFLGSLVVAYMVHAA